MRGNNQSGYGPIYSEAPSGRHAWIFNGTNQHLSGPSNTNLAFGTGSFSIECWVKFDTVAITNVAFVQGDVNLSSSTGKWWFGATGTGSAITQLYMGQHGGSNISGGVSWIPDPGTWYHVAVCRNGSTDTRFFVNGIQQGSTQSIAANYQQNGWAIGVLTTPVYFDGMISDVRVTNTALYTASFGVPHQKLTAVAGTQLLTCQDSTLIDRSPNNVTVSNSNNVQSTDVAGPPGTYFGAFEDEYRHSVALEINAGLTTQTRWKDSAKNFSIARTGSSVVNSTTQTKFNSTSISFPGVNANFLQTASSADLTFGTGVTNSSARDFTIEAWVYPVAQNLAGPTIISNFSSTFASGAWTITYAHSVTGANRFALWIGTSSTSAPVITSAADFPVNAWYHVVVTRWQQTYNLFVNGVLVGQYSSSASFDSGSTNFIRVGHGGSTTSSFTGFIDQVRITKKSRQYTFIPGDFPTSAPSDPYYADVVSFYKFEGTNGQTSITDELGNSATVGTGAMISSTQAKFGSTSLFIPYHASAWTGIRTQSIAIGANDFTLEAWLYVTDITTGNLFQTIFDSRTGAADASGIAVAWDTNGTEFVVSVGGTTYITATVNIPLNQWFHVAVTRCDGYLRAFLNGDQLGASTGTTASIASRTFSIGALAFGGSTGAPTYRPLRGYMDNVRITVGQARYPAYDVPTAAFQKIGSF
jgi:hypothetical protein